MLKVEWIIIYFKHWNAKAGNQLDTIICQYITKFKKITIIQNDAIR